VENKRVEAYKKGTRLEEETRDGEGGVVTKKDYD